MLLRPLFALLLCLLIAGLPLAVQTAQAAEHPSQGCMQQQDASPGDCGGGMATDACAAHCVAGACAVAAITVTELPFVSLRPSGHEAVHMPECRAAPDTAPPKTLLP